MLALSFFTLLFTWIGQYGILAAGYATLTTSVFQIVFFLPIAIKRYRETAPNDDVAPAQG